MVAIRSDNKPVRFEQEVCATFDCIRESLRKLDADMDKIMSIKVYLTLYPMPNSPGSAVRSSRITHPH